MHAYFDSEIEFNKDFIIILNNLKRSIIEIESTAFIFSNIGEFYFNIGEYKKALVFLNFANLYYEAFSKQNPNYLKNLSIIAYGDYKLTSKKENSQKLFKNILTNISNSKPSYHKVFTYRLYGDYLNDTGDILANKYYKESNDLETKFNFFECRKSYLLLPNENESISH